MECRLELTFTGGGRGRPGVVAQVRSRTLAKLASGGRLLFPSIPPADATQPSAMNSRSKLVMSQSHEARTAHVGPWVIDTREIGHRAGSSRVYTRDAPAPTGFGLDMIKVPEGEPVELDVLAESVVEGVLVSGTAVARLSGECVRCLDPISEEIEVEVRELFAYPDSATDASTDDDEVGRVVDDLIDLEPVVRDAMLLSLPSAPLCSPDCPGLCSGCGVKWAELAPDHTHETIDPRWAALQERFSGTEEEK